MPGTLSPQTLRDRLDSPQPLALLDVRESLDYVDGHIEESTWVHRSELEDRLPDLVPNRSTPVVLCDEDGERGEIDARWLERLGYEDVSSLEGGVAAWRGEGYDTIEAAEGVHATAFSYGSKKFGEEVDVERDLPKMGPEELADRHEDALVVDVRNAPEHEKYDAIPGSINLEGVDLALYVEALREDDEQPVVVHCAGRTRSIIGTATLEKLGVDNAYELENGTMGWELAGYDLAEGEGRPDELSVDGERYERLRESVEALLEENDVPFVSPAELERLEEDVPEAQTVYRFDVRREAEFAAGHVPGSRWVPGGQLIQTTGSHVAVRDGTVVVISEGHVRAGITAYWLDEMGYDVRVLRGGTTAWTEDGGDLVTEQEVPALGSELVDGAVERIPPAELPDLLRQGDATVVNVGDIDDYTAGHVPCSRWVPRTDLEGLVESGTIGTDRTVVLVCEDGTVSGRAAAQVATELDVEDLAVLEGGLERWRAEEMPIEDDERRLLAEPRDAVPKPYAQGREAMEKYLEWEEGLVEETDAAN